MFDSFDELVFLMACGIALIIFGSGVAFFPSRRDKILLAFAAIAATVGGAWGVSPHAAYAEALVGAGVAAFLGVVWLSRQIPVVALRSVLVRPAVIGVVTAASGAGLIAAGSWHFDFSGDVNERHIEFLEKMALWHPDLAVADLETKTDRGTVVPVYAATAPRSKAKVREDETALLAGFEWGKRIIPRGPGDDVTNCHGWVFTGGQYWVKGQDVPTILKDHDYKPQRRPMAGDVAAYRDADGKISHTGIVRSVGTVTMVESKWGWMGVYLHAAEDSCYGTNIVYYRGPRTGHQLAALNPNDARPKPRTTFGGGVSRPPIR